MPKLDAHYFVPTKLAGIPCLAGITYYEYTPKGRGSSYQYSSPEDWLGWEDFEFEITDRKGYPAAWLAAKMTSKDKVRIEREISEWFTERESQYD